MNKDIVGKLVVITEGPMKGLLGIVEKHYAGTTVRPEIVSVHLLGHKNNATMSGLYSFAISDIGYALDKLPIPKYTDIVCGGRGSRIQYMCIDDVVPPKPWEIDKVIFNGPATVVFWKDGTKTVVKAQDNENCDKEKGLAMCICKKILGNKGNYYNTFRKYLEDKNDVVR